MGIEKLSIEQKIGQMLIITLQEKQITKETIDLIKKYNIGGVIGMSIYPIILLMLKQVFKHLI